MSVLGLTLDYGPFSFLNEYDPGFTPNASDHTRRCAPLTAVPSLHMVTRYHIEHTFSAFQSRSDFSYCGSALTKPVHVVCSYRFSHQPAVAKWNCAVLGTALAV